MIAMITMIAVAAVAEAERNNFNLAWRPVIESADHIKAVVSLLLLCSCFVVVFVVVDLVVIYVAMLLLQ